MPQWAEFALSLLCGACGAWAWAIVERRRREKELVAEAEEKLTIEFRIRDTEQQLKTIQEERGRGILRLQASRDKQLERALIAMEKLSRKLGDARSDDGAIEADRDS